MPRLIKPLMTLSLLAQLFACAQEADFSGTARSVENTNNLIAAASGSSSKASVEPSCSLKLASQQAPAGAKIYVTVIPTGFEPKSGQFSLNGTSQGALSCASNLCLGQYETTGKQELLEARLVPHRGEEISCQLKTGTTPNQADTDASTNPDSLADTAASSHPSNLTDTAASNIPPPPPAPEYIEKTFSFTVTQSLLSAPPTEVEVVFIIDDSASMTNKIKRLSSALAGLATQIASNTSNIKVNLSYVLLSEYLSSRSSIRTNGSSGIYNIMNDPYFYGTYHASGKGYFYEVGKSPSNLSYQYMTSTMRDHLVQAVNASKIQAMVTALNQLVVSPKLENELGIAAMMDYLNFRKYSPNASAKLTTQTPVHYVVLSDEDNSRLRNYFQVSDLEIEAYTPSHFYAQTDNQISRFSAPNSCLPLGLDSNPSGVYINNYAALHGYCVYRNLGLNATQAVALIKSRPHPTTSKLVLYSAKLSDGTSGQIAVSGETKFSFCKYYNKFDCKKRVDGVLVAFNDLAYNWLKVSDYESCSPVTSSLTRDFFYSPSYPAAPNAAIECVEPTEKPFSYQTSLSLKTSDQGQTYSRLEANACSADTDYVIRSSLDYASFVDLQALRPATDPAKQLKILCGKQIGQLTVGPGINANKIYPQAPTVTQYKEMLWYVWANATSALTLDKLGDLWRDYYKSSSSSSQSQVLNGIKALSTPGAVRFYRDYPESAVDYFNQIHADHRVFVHSIVRTAAGACSQDSGDSPDAKVARDYIRLSRMTGGLSLNICNSDFTPLMSQIFDFVKYSNVVNYDLKAIVDSDTATLMDYLSVVKVVNKTSSKTLADNSFQIVKDQLSLNLGAASAGDQMNVTIRLPKLSQRPVVPTNAIEDKNYIVGLSGEDSIQILSKDAKDAGLNLLISYTRSPALAPLDCTQPQVNQAPDDQDGVTIIGLYKSTPYSLRICVKDRNGNMSRGRILTAATIGYTPPPSSSGSSTPAPTGLDSCAVKINSWFLDIKAPRDQEGSITKLCSCAGFTTGNPIGPDATGGYGLNVSPCSAATQQGLLDENDNDVPIKLTLYKRYGETYGPFIGKKANGVSSRNGADIGTTFNTMFRVSKP